MEDAALNASRLPFVALTMLLAVSAGTSRSPAPVARPAVAPIEVPFRYEHRSITLEARIDGGRPLRMLLDTGWGPTTLDVRIARELGLLSAGQKPEEAGTRRLRELRVGPLALRDWTVDLRDLEGINPEGEPYDGVLGCGFLRDRIAEIDFARQRIRLLSAPPATEGTPGTQRTTVPIRFGPLGCLPLCDSVWVNDRRLTGLFDTGAAVRVLVTPQAAGFLGLSDSVARMRRVTGGFYDQDSSAHGVAHLGRLRRVRIGSIAADTVGAVFPGSGQGLTDQPLEAWGVLIGNRFLEDFRVTLDYRNLRITLERPAPH